MKVSKLNLLIVKFSLTIDEGTIKSFQLLFYITVKQGPRNCNSLNVTIEP